MSKSKLDHALELAALGFYVFPIVAGKKAPPAVKDWQTWATRMPAQICGWWEQNPDCNIGISTSKFGDNEALLVVDVDNKGEKHGDEQILRLELEGADLPSTREHVTPTGGRHLIYRVGRAVKQGVDVLGPGLDVRSAGGYVVAPGSVVERGVYRCKDSSAAIAVAPTWLIDRCGRANRRDRQDQPAAGAVRVDPDAAIARARHYLDHEAPASIKGQGGDSTAYAVAARVKDFGVDEATCLELMLGAWNDRSPPGWSPEKLAVKVRNAYRYGIDPPGVAAPEAVFAPVESPKPAEKLHPFDELNKCHAFVVIGGGSHVLWETTDHHGRPTLEHLDIATFHRKYAARKMNMGKRDEKITELWMESPKRRSYDGLVFMPQLDCPARFYNLWRGFAYEPAPKYEPHPAVEAWLEHAKDNVCHGDDRLFRWLVGYFAHLIQRPWEKPLVALVFRGGKGVGKNALVERVGALLGGHFLLTSNRRYLVGNFNGHLENLLLFALDEAFWSGDKQAEGQLKDLITGAQHVIEHKGKEPYTVENRTRICIIGNEEWLVPTSHDERRFAVFDVGDGRRADHAYFTAMREGMEAGGYSLFLRYLLDFDTSGIDFNDAPQTKGLLDQKHASLDVLEQWWLDCLTSGRIVAGDFEHAFGAHAECERLRTAYRRYARDRNIRSRTVDDKTFGRILKKICPLVVPSRSRSGSELLNTYKLPSLEDARKCWDKFIGHEVQWDT